MTKDEIAKLISFATANSPYQQGKDMADTARLWFVMLSDIPYQLAQKALIKITAQSKFFPTVSEIRDAIKGFSDSKLPNPEEAWLEVMQKLDRYKSPEWSCEEIKKAVRAIGYLAICDSENLGVERAHFMRIYETFKKRTEDEQLNLQLEIIFQNQKLLTSKGESL